MNKNTSDGLAVFFIVVLVICVLQVGAICSDRGKPHAGTSTEASSIGLSGWEESDINTLVSESKSGKLNFQFKMSPLDAYGNKFPSVYKRGIQQIISNDSIEFEIYTESKHSLPASALTIGFYTSARGKPYTFSIPAKNKKWVKVNIPINQIQGFTYRQIYFQIIKDSYRKAGYKDGDEVKFKVKNLHFAKFKPKIRSIDKLLDSSPEIIHDYPDITKLVMDSDVTHNTKKSLRIDIDKSLGDLKFKGTYKKPADVKIWIKLAKHDIDINSFTRLKFYLKIKGARHAFIKMGFADANKKLLSGEMCPIDAGDWRRYTYNLWRNVESAEYLWINVYQSGYNVDEKPLQSIYIDDLQLSNAPLRHSKGWSIDPTVITVNQAGFNLYKEKLALANSKYINNKFDIIDTKDGKVYFTGIIKPEKSAIGTTGVIDFTDLTRPGNYKVVSGTIKSPSFDIGIKAYDKCISLVSDWVANMRCGCKTDYHAPCHMDDGYLPTLDKERNIIKREHLDVSGGWHDAGDCRTYYNYSVRMGFWLLPAYQAGWTRDRNTDGTEDFYDSALWAMKHIVKIRNPHDGRIFYKIADNTFKKKAKYDHQFGNYWTDNIPGNHDDRIILPGGSWGISYAAWAIESISRFVKCAKPEDKELADKMLAIAKERWDYWFTPETGAFYAKNYPSQRTKKVAEHNVIRTAYFGKATLALYNATGRKEKKYYDFIIKCADKILASQNKMFSEKGDITGDVYVTSERKMKGRNGWWSEGDRYVAESFIAECLQTLPENELYWKWRSFLVISSEWWMKSTRAKWQPFSLPHAELKSKYLDKGDFTYKVNKNENTRYQSILPLAGGYQTGESAFCMWKVATALNDTELENLALRQLQWVIGFNPFGVSWVCEFGEDYIDQFYSFTQGIMPGQMGTSVGMGKYTGVKEKGIPGVSRPVGAESHTVVGAIFSRALAVLSRPATLKLKIMQGGVPYKGKVTILWSKNETTVYKGKTNSKGNLPIIKLDGGQTYTLKIGKTIVPLSVISGTSISKTIDLNNLVSLAAKVPENVNAGQPFTMNVDVTNLGLKKVKTEILCFSDGVKGKQQSKKIELDVGETKVISWEFKADDKPGAFVVSFKENRKRAQIIDVTGRINP